MHAKEIEKLREWFLNQRRELPWREDITPYKIWVSEVMLQQTQVAVVIPYFLHWMRLFPSIADLASAQLDDVLKAWEGLGYYSRARNLHSGAQQVISTFGGQLPEDEKSLQTIKGLGPYTIGAIRAFAFKRKAAAVDGNVLRVLTRYKGIEEDIARAKTVKNIQATVSALLPDHEPWIISEALIELGAVICTRKAKCALCPLKNSCVALKTGRVEQLPIKSKNTKKVFLYRLVPIIVSQEHCLVRRTAKDFVMSDLHEFPYFESTQEEATSTDFLFQKIKDWGLVILHAKKLENVRHGFTHHEATLYPVIMDCKEQVAIPGYVWMSFKQLDRLAFSSGHRRLYQAVRNRFSFSL